MYIRKIFKVGNSLVLALPPELLEQLNIKRGDNVAVGVDANLKIIICAVDVEAINEASPPVIDLPL